MNRIQRVRRLALAILSLAVASPAEAGGEAGSIVLRDQGFFWVGVRPKQVTLPGIDGTPAPGTVVEGQMYVAFQFPQERRHPYPLVLIHGGGGQATPWMGTPDGRDGWLDYFLAEGFDVYIIDRPGWGRSTPAPSYGTGFRMTGELIADFYTSRSKQFPGGGAADSPELRIFLADTQPGPAAPNAVLKEDMAELLDRIGPAILVTTSLGGPAGWLATDARPAAVRGILAIEPEARFAEELAPLMNLSPSLPAGETMPTEMSPADEQGLAPCALQPAGKERRAPAFDGKSILYVVSPLSLYTATASCTVKQLNQFGADAHLARLTDYGIEGNGHMMMVELNNGEIARKVLIPWLVGVE